MLQQAMGPVVQQQLPQVVQELLPEVAQQQQLAMQQQQFADQLQQHSQALQDRLATEMQQLATHMTTHMTTQMQPLLTQLGALGQRLGAVEQRLGAVEQGLAAVQADVGRLVNRTSVQLRLALQYNSVVRHREQSLEPVPHPDTGAMPPDFPATLAGRGKLPCMPCLLLFLAPAAPNLLPQQAAESAFGTDGTVSMDPWMLPHLLPLPGLLPCAELQDMTVAKLQELLQFYQQPHQGTRQVLVSRLLRFIGGA